MGTIHHYYWKRLGHKCDDILMQEIAINRGQPQITITLTPKIDGKVLKAEETFDHSVRYRDYVLSVSQGKIVNYIVDSKTFELKKKLKIAFALNKFWNIPSNALTDVFFIY